MSLKKYVEDNPKLVRRRESIRYPGLFVIKYTNKVFYDNLWTPELEKLRGLVVDADYNIVVWPFDKIYNRFERDTDFPQDKLVMAVRKVNGFMAAATYHEKYGVIISTTGSLDSDFVTLAEKHLRPRVTEWIEKHGQDVTWLFEICDPTDPHIIPETPGPYLIGARSLISGKMLDQSWLDYKAGCMGNIHRPDWWRHVPFSYVCDWAKRCTHEGFVVYDSMDRALKIKSPYYLVTKFLARKKGERLIDLLSDIPKLRLTVAEEYYPLLDHIEADIEFPGLDEQGRIEVIRNFFESRI